MPTSMNTVGASVAAGGIPAGMIAPYGGSSAPAGWLVCDGSSYQQSSYPALYAAIGTTYGSSGSGYFSVPNLQGRVPAGVNSGDGNFQTIGNTGGNSTVSLAYSNLPSHNHGIYDPGHYHNYTAVNHSHGGAYQQRQVEATSQQANYGATTLGNQAQQGSGNTAQGGSAGISLQGSYANLQGTSQTGSGAAHNNLQPYITLLYIINA